jgi:hypothetical protein
MRLQVSLLLVIEVILTVSPLANALEEITVEKPFVARNLSGVVVDPSGSPISGVVVEQCDASFVQSEVYNGQGQSAGKVLVPDCNREPGHAITITTNDANGRFGFPNVKSGRVYYLHLSGPGFDPMQVTVKLRFFARAGVRIQLRVAT